ncbi:MAG: PrsW family glutamic-type intramembrane protease [Saprospiraceae bacterium]|nr:PrsW family glutamic-type intramembrane protease [Saprospiraceae bacterium]
MSSLLIAIAVLPGLLVCWLVYRADRYEREPVAALALCFGLGAAATLPAMMVEKQLLPLVGEIGEDPVLTFLVAFGAISPVEELVKWFALIVGAFLWRFFNEPFDGIVYSVMVGMGFATMENVFYLDMFGQETALLRTFTAIPAHLVFAIAVGYYAGLAKFNPAERVHLLLRGLLVGMLLHGAYDFLVLQNWTKWLSSFGAATVYLCLYYFGTLFREHLENSPFKPRDEIELYSKESGLEV